MYEQVDGQTDGRMDRRSVCQPVHPSVLHSLIFLYNVGYRCRAVGRIQLQHRDARRPRRGGVELVLLIRLHPDKLALPPHPCQAFDAYYNIWELDQSLMF